MTFFMKFHEPNHFFKSWNATFLVLIPEKGVVEGLKDFGLMIGASVLYKMYTRVCVSARVVSSNIKVSKVLFPRRLGY